MNLKLQNIIDFTICSDALFASNKTEASRQSILQIIAFVKVHWPISKVYEIVLSNHAPRRKKVNNASQKTVG